MKALVLRQYNQFEYEDVPDPQIGPEDVLIRVDACGICGSDIHGMDGSTQRRIPPIIMGHEASGVIAQVGAKVTGWHERERVTFDSTISCGQCRYCRRGLINLCDNRRVMGVSCADYRQHGAFAEYVAVPQRILYRIPDQVTFEQATMIETLAVAFHAASRTPITLNDTAAVVGAGMVGLLVIQALRLAGCGKIIAIDLDQDRLNLACKLGADLGIKSDAIDAPAEVFKLTENLGADVAIEVVGIGPALQVAIASLKKGGSLTLVGNVQPSVEFPLQAVVTRQITLYGSCASNGEYPACLEMLARGATKVDSIISAVAPLSEGASWFHRLHNREPGLMKVILRP